MTSTKIKRYLKKELSAWLFQGKVLIVYGARQVGKTTLVQELIAEHTASLYMNCERQHVWELLSSGNLERIRQYIGDATLVVFDEAQKIKEIGSVLKLLIDTYPEIQYIATGSSSFDLSNALAEPLTGRNLTFLMYPVALSELAEEKDLIIIDEMLEGILLYGSYPDIVYRSEAQKRVLLDQLTSDYLFRDVLSFERIRKPEILVNLLKAIALQIGHEVSMRELSCLLKISVETVQRYLQLLEQSFVLFSLGSFSRNLRNEITKGRKYFFYDLGIRNNIIQNYAPLSVRNDVGSLWENYCIIERIKRNKAMGFRPNQYFWRTYQQQEIDYLEEYDGQIRAWEFKWNPAKGKKVPVTFRQAYPECEVAVVTRESYHSFLL
jgi:predicted AAA+ superfamily ATPase